VSHREHWALRDIDLVIQRGETVGILGQNGAGKSTLLALIAGTSGATTGTVNVDGRVSALLELGVGFHPEWSGRENAEFYVRLLGANRAERTKWLSDIEAFADIGDYYDQPLRTYSSGMAVRVAFAAAVCIEPEVLIVDEALAVGDAPFQHKCFQRLAQFKASGATILLVTHRVDIVTQLCTRALVLQSGRIGFDGEPGAAVNHYVNALYADGSTMVRDDQQGFDQRSVRLGQGGAKIIAIERLNRSRPVASGDALTFSVAIRFERDVAHPVFAFSIKSVEDIILYSSATGVAGASLAAAKAGDEITVHGECPMPLPTGAVFLDFIISSFEGEPVMLDALFSAVKIEVTGPPGFLGLVDLGAKLWVDGVEAANAGNDLHISAT
jgi:lipopolysaccharide transport system ATP-binding protein